MVQIMLNLFSNYLLEFMTVILFFALSFRYLALRHSKNDEAYYSRFTRELDACIDEDKAKGVLLIHLLHRFFLYGIECKS